MKLVKKTMLVVAISSAFAVSANAGDLNWNYANLNYVSNDVSGVGGGSGLGLEASFGVSDSVNVFLGYQSPSYTAGSVTETKFGAGYHQPTSSTSDWYFKGDFRTYDIAGTSASGFAFSGGARGDLSDKFELDGYIGYTMIDLGGTNFNGVIFGIDGTYKITDKFGVTVGYMSDNDAVGWTGIKLGARMYF
jgi:hypothetical protein